jgi:hypothetical protein
MKISRNDSGNRFQTTEVMEILIKIYPKKDTGY